ncbi:MAG: hypothetical protein Unbinned767contig1000_22 [Prokaryotic dsDNA virus sp.]|nr:MAG: hypothetical protein Unbinned767contig1000_22 [Prokaryotic dsDNA virus sp.]|tara:strand:- start:12676 stop:17157 length:4482 start_codon:yes stop_codon:yes gene_type:complete
MSEQPNIDLSYATKDYSSQYGGPDVTSGFFGEDPFTDMAAGLGAGILGGFESILSLGSFGTLEFEDNFGLFDSPESTFGNLISGIAQVGVGYLTGGAVLKGVSGAAKWAGMAKTANVAKNMATAQQMSTVGGRLAAEAGRGATAEFLAFKGDEGRLSDILQDVPGLEWTEFLASEEDDSDVVGRVKNVIEGMGLGLAVDGVLEIFRAVKKAGKAQAQGNAPAVVSALEEADDAAARTRVASREAVGAEPRRYEDMSTEEVQLRNVLGDLDESFDPNGGAIILARNVTGDEAVIHGTDRIDFTHINAGRKDDAYSSVGAFQLSRDAKVFDATVGSKKVLSKRAREVLGPIADDKGLPWLDKMDRLRAILKETGEADVVRVGHEHSIINMGAITANIRRIPGDPLSSVIKHATASVWSRIPKAVSENMPVMNMLRGMNLSHDHIMMVAEDLDKLVKSGASAEDMITKLPGGLNISKLSGNDVQMLHMLRQQMIKGGKETALTRKVKAEGKTRPETHLGTEHKLGKDMGELNQEAVEEMAKMLGRPIAELGQQMRQDIRAVEGAALRWHSAKGVIDAYSTTLHDMLALAKKLDRTSDLSKLSSSEKSLLTTMGEDGTETFMTKEVFREHINRLSTDLYTFSDLNGFLGGAIGQGLQRGRFGTQTWDTAAYEAAIARHGPGRYDALARQHNKQLDMSRGNHTVSTGIAMAAQNPKMQGILRFYYASILGAPKTLATNIFGMAGTAFTRPLERFMGSMVAKKLMGPEMAAKFESAMKRNLEEFRLLAQETRDISVVFARMARGDKTLQTGSRQYKGAARAAAALKDPSRPGLAGNAGWVEQDVTGLKKKSILNLPTGLMKLSDEIGKHSVFFSRVRSELGAKWDEMEALIKSDPDKYADLDYRMGKVDKNTWVEAEAMNMISRDHAATRESLYMEAAAAHPHRAYPDSLERAQAIKAHVDNRMKYGVSTGDHGRPMVETTAGSGVSGRQEIIDRAVGQAQDVSFTTPLSQRVKNNELSWMPKMLASTGHMFQKLTTQFPTTKFFLPFVQTPTNLLITASDRMLVPFVNQDFTDLSIHFMKKGKAKLMGQEAPALAASNTRIGRALARGNAEEIAEITGRMTTAVGVTSIFGGLAAAGHLTGAGPDNKDQKALLQQTGWQPYSVKMGDVYVSYRRMDPLATMLGTIADVFDHLKFEVDEFSRTPMTDAFEAISIAVFEQIKSKSYLQGVGDFMDMVTDPTKAVPNTAGKLLGNLIPNTIGAAEGISNQNMEEFRGILGRLKQRIPGDISADHKRNALGEKITRNQWKKGAAFMGFVDYAFGIQMNIANDDVIDNELASLNFPLSPPDPEMYGVDLRDMYNHGTGQSAYDRWQELTSEIKLYGKDLRGSLRRTIKGVVYKNALGMAIDELGLENMRGEMLRADINMFRQEAFDALLDEFPDLQERQRMHMSANYSQREGGSIDSITGSEGYRKYEQMFEERNRPVLYRQGSSLYGPLDRR